MERGPYDRPPEEPGYPRRDPAYAPPPEYEPPADRRFGVSEVVAMLALIAAIVAIFLALDARGQGSEDEQVARQVRQETQRQIQQIRSSVGQQAGTAGQRAREAEAEAEQTRETASQLNSQVSDLRGEVSSLRSQQNQIRDSIQSQSEAIADIRRTLRE